MHGLDILGDNLRAIFGGINRPLSAELAWHNFSRASNRFWTVLHRAGFTDILLQPHEERRLLGYGYGITAVVDRDEQSVRRVTRSSSCKLAPRSKHTCGDTDHARSHSSANARSR